MAESKPLAGKKVTPAKEHKEMASKGKRAANKIKKQLIPYFCKVSNLYRIKFKEGGQVPAAMGGAFLNAVSAQKEIDTYLSLNKAS